MKSIGLSTLSPQTEALIPKGNFLHCPTYFRCRDALHVTRPYSEAIDKVSDSRGRRGPKAEFRALVRLWPARGCALVPFHPGARSACGEIEASALMS